MAERALDVGAAEWVRVVEGEITLLCRGVQHATFRFIDLFCA